MPYTASAPHAATAGTELPSTSATRTARAPVATPIRPMCLDCYNGQPASAAGTHVVHSALRRSRSV